MKMDMGKESQVAHGAPGAGVARDLVVGLGKTGFTCVRYLHSQGRRVLVNDSRVAPPLAGRLRRELPQIEVHLGAFDPDLLDHADRLVASPGVPMHEPLLAQAVSRDMPVVSDIDLFFEHCRAPVVGITGSNGKSTVTCWLESVLTGAGKRTAVGGNLGTPALDLLDAPTPDQYLLELSSFQLERSAALPLRVAALLNVSPDHMDHHASMDAYVAAKSRIFAAAHTAVVRRDIANLVPANHAHRITFGEDAPAPGHYGLIERDGETFLARGEDCLLPVAELRLPLRHDWINALAVLACAEALGVGWPAARSGLVSFTGLAHRVQIVARRDGVTWIDDSKGTNVGATISAIRSVGAPLVLIAGGDAKGADLAPLADVLRTRARAVIVLGKDAPRLDATLRTVCDIHRVGDIEAAVRRAAAVARPGDTVLLSPACSSLDMYSGFAERGERFCRELEALT
jgi:UDP-N-acetylmuramoylalanine--D-glutamate ligase